MDEWKELTEIVRKYGDASGTHEKRFILLLEKHKDIIKSLLAFTVSITPAIPQDRTKELTEIMERLGSLYLEFGENLQDMASDSNILIEFFQKGFDFCDKEKKK